LDKTDSGFAVLGLGWSGRLLETYDVVAGSYATNRGGEARVICSPGGLSPLERVPDTVHAGLPGDFVGFVETTFVAGLLRGDGRSGRAL
jgi:hypothetical protein